ncbi:MAG: sortase [Patescibacteria group bacterium]|nr:sortase [Patescibacteria group bacterium]
MVLAVSCLTFIGGAYLLLLTQSSTLPALPVPGFRQPVISIPDDTNHVEIAKIGVNTAIVTGNAGALEKGAWHRFPERGDPEKGGNFILSAHRFQLGLTPEGTRSRSPFYKLDKLVVGDEIVVVYNKNRYTYQVTKTYDVPRTAVEIEAPSETAKLTLYSCNIRGEAAGRIVVEAELKQ